MITEYLSFFLVTPHRLCRVLFATRLVLLQFRNVIAGKFLRSAIAGIFNLGTIYFKTMIGLRVCARQKASFQRARQRRLLDHEKNANFSRLQLECIGLYTPKVLLSTFARHSLTVQQAPLPVEPIEHELSP